MAIDAARAKAVTLPSLEVEIERGRLRVFAAAVGEPDPVYVHLDAAREAGHRDLPILPTFLFSLELEDPHPFAYLDEMGVDLRGVLHGEQTFTYHSTVYAGDTITVRPRIADAYAKNDRMDFVVKHTDFLCGDELVGEADSLVVVRDVEAA